MKKLFFLFVCLFTFAAIAQPNKQEQLEAKKAAILKEMFSFKKLLNVEKKKEKSTLSKISENNARIKLSEKFISTTTKQMRQLDDDIYITQKKINKLNRELKVLKEDYSKMIVKSYKSRNDNSRVMFVLSSNSFLQAYKRIQYMKQYTSFRKNQGDEIKEKQDDLMDNVAKLEKSKYKKEKVLEETIKEKEALIIQKQEREDLIKIIQKDKKKYTAEISKKQQEANDIDKQIKRIIAEAIAKANREKAAREKAAREKAIAEGKIKKVDVPSTPSTYSGSSDKFDLTPEGKIVSSNFKANKGKLPWPVDNGFIQVRYGNQPHPAISSLQIYNSGIEIATSPGSRARAIFDGEVMNIQKQGTTNLKAVYIRHADFITVYLNLDNISVSIGQKINVKQTLGVIHTNSSNKSVLKFVIYQNSDTLNPESWLGRS